MEGHEPLAVRLNKEDLKGEGVEIPNNDRFAEDYEGRGRVGVFH